MPTYGVSGRGGERSWNVRDRKMVNSVVGGHVTRALSTAQPGRFGGGRARARALPGKTVTPVGAAELHSHDEHGQPFGAHARDVRRAPDLYGQSPDQEIARAHERRRSQASHKRPWPLRRSRFGALIQGRSFDPLQSRQFVPLEISAPLVGWRCSPARCGAPRVPQRRLAAWIRRLVHGAPRAVLGGTVERPDDDPAGWPEQPFGGAGRLGRGRVRCRCPARSHARIARVAADPPRAVLGGRELLRRAIALLSGGERARDPLGARELPRSTRSTACAGWRSRACVGRANLPRRRTISRRGTARRNASRRSCAATAARS